MSHPLEHPKAIELLQRVSQYFQSEDTYILPDSRNSLCLWRKFK